MKITFEKAVALVLDEEGGLSLRRNDKGNWTGGQIGKGQLKGTKYGISAASFPHLDIRNLTIEEARKMYKRMYWDVLQAETLPEHLRLTMFDVAVNSGPTVAIRMLQRLAGVRTDGRLGPTTLAKAESVSLAAYTQARVERYLNIIKADPTQEENRDGWLNRAADIAEATEKLLKT